MSPELERILESKRAYRKQLAERPVAEKLRIVEELAERTLATRKDTSSPLPEEPWPIPKNWRWSRMGEVATIIGGSTPRTDRAEYFGGDVPWITPADLSRYDEKTISRGARNITQAGLENSGARLMPAKTILFSSRAPIGYVAIAANPVATNQGFKSFVLRDELLPDYVYYYLQRAKEFAVALASGTTFLEISAKNAARLPIPVPPLDAQRRIVAEIEKQFTRLEAGVAALRRVQTNLKRHRAAVLKAACEGRLVPTEAELCKSQSGSGVPPLNQGKQSRAGSATLPATFETGKELLARILTQRRQNWQGRGKYKEPAAPGTTKLPQVPEGWTWASLEQLLIYLRNGWGLKPDAEAGVAILRISAVRPMSVNLDEIRYLNGSPSDYAGYSVAENDLLFTRYNGNPNLTGVCGVVPPLDKMIVHPDKLIRVRLVPALCLPKFVCMVVNVGTSRQFLASRVRTTAGQAGISGSDLRGIPILLPPLAEQTRIVAEVERRLSVVEELEAMVSANLQRATRLRQSILQKAFTGGL